MSAIDPWDASTRGELRSLSIETYKTAGSTRADVLLLECDGKRAVLKDYTSSSKGFSLLIAPFLVSREIRCLRTLDDIQQIPRLIRKVSRQSFLMEYLPTERIRDVQDELDWGAFIGHTRALVSQINARGVAHGDLRNATNILVDSKQHPVFVDFVSAVHRGARWNPFSAALFQLCLRIDQGAMHKLCEKYAPDLVSDNDRIAYARQGWMERSVRWFSVHIRNTIQRIFP